MTTGQNIADEVRTQLNDGDASNLRWSDAEILSYINAGQRQIVMLVPEANIASETVALADAVRQTLPSGGIKFISLENDNDNDNPGPAVRIVEQDALSSAFPEWEYAGHQSTHMNYPTFEDEHTEFFFEHFFHDPREPKAYYLFPPTDGETPDVLLKYSKLPTALGTLAGTFALGDEYLNAEIEYVTYRCLMKDGRYSASTARRQELWNNFLRALGLKVEAEAKADPATNRPPEDNHG